MDPTEPAPEGVTPSSDPGLCDRCSHVRLVRTRRGGKFYMCELSTRDDHFPRYPSLPVTRCDGFQQIPSAGDPCRRQ